MADGKVSLKRIRDLLVSEELDSEPDRLNSVDSTSDQCAITVENASFRWEQPPIATSTKTSTSPTATRVDTPVEAYQLKGISLRIPKGALVAVVGTVGAGKVITQENAGLWIMRVVTPHTHSLLCSVR